MKLDYFKVNLGDVVVNLGAHHGEMTKFYSSRVGLKGKVFAIEPEIKNANILYYATMDLDNVYTFNLAIGEKTHMGVLYVGTNSINHSTVRVFSGDVQEVQVITWDDFVTREGISLVHLANVDVEGAEVQWLKGMTHTLPNHIILEEHSRFAYDFNELDELLRKKGYMYIKEGFHMYATSEALNET